MRTEQLIVADAARTALEALCRHGGRKAETARALHLKKGREETGLFLAEGLKIAAVVANTLITLGVPASRIYAGTDQEGDVALADAATSVLLVY